MRLRKCADDNGFNPVFNETFVFSIDEGDVALLRFTVMDYVLWGESRVFEVTRSGTRIDSPKTILSEEMCCTFRG